jgi:LacI family transcriptional regulator
VVVLITIKDIAREAGVSTATVSYVINGTRPVLPEKRDRVLEVIAKTDYQPNRVAKSLRTKKTNIIGVLAEDILAFPSARIINGISEYVENTDYQILLYDLRMLDSLFNQYHQIVHNSDKINKALSLLVNGANVDAVIYIGMFDRDISGVITDIKKPFVMAYSSSKDEHSYSVSYENEDVSTELTRRVIDCGHEHIAVITGLAHTPPAKMRMKGITKAFREAGLVLDSAFVKYGDWERETGYSCMKELLQQESETLPTAVIAMNDLMAIGAMDAIRDANLRVPQDISVVGFDNREVSEFVYPKLSTVEIDLEEIGRKATELTNKLLNKDTSIPENHSMLISSRLIMRDTLRELYSVQ